DARLDSVDELDAQAQGRVERDSDLVGAVVAHRDHRLMLHLAAERHSGNDRDVDATFEAEGHLVAWRVENGLERATDLPGDEARRDVRGVILRKAEERRIEL